MAGTLQEQMRADLRSLGWEITEIQFGIYWTTTLRRGEASIVSTGIDRQQVWNAAYRDALRHCNIIRQSPMPGAQPGA
jgi:hypothetical protein